MMKNSFLFAVITITLLSCQLKAKKSADSIYFNGRILTMDNGMKEAEVMVVKDGKVIAIGNQSLLNEYECEDEYMLDLRSQIVYPGLIDAHCHFFGYAKNMLTCNLVGTKSWTEVVKKLDSFAKKNPSEWVIGRGWDQNDWTEKKFPDNVMLNMLFPDKPVILKRIDGHAAICNQKALELAGINNKTKIKGGEIVKKGYRITGVLIDNAVDLVERHIPAPSNKELIEVLQKAEKECYSLGLTTLADAGLDLQQCFYLDSLGKNSALSIYLYLMLNPTEAGLNYALNHGIKENGHCRIGSFKLYGDGSLGSRGAKMKQDYCDHKGYSGMFLFDEKFYDSFCNKVYHQTKYQVNTHCIGDSSNRKLLEIYGRYLKPTEERRWRIEHAQILDMNDIALFGQYRIIPSVQPTHATSDAPWVKDRICDSRMPGAYAYKSLLKQNGYLPLGTDFPVEYLNTLYTFYSAVFRLNANEPNQDAFLISEALSAEEALKGMTIWAAKACMLDHRKGSLETGKDADFVIMDKDLLKVKKEDVLSTKVIATYRSGKKVY